MNDYDVMVIGGGPAGYVAAIKAAQLGGKVALVEADRMGGTCLNRGCIPTKAYLHSAGILESIHSGKQFGVTVDPTGVQIDMRQIVDNKDGIVKKLTGGVDMLVRSHGVEVFNGHGTYDGGHVFVDGARVGKGKKIILCGGSRAIRLPIPGADNPNVLTSDEILGIAEVPERLVVIGAGVVGVEMAAAFSAFGSRVVMIESMDRALPMMDEELSLAAEKMLRGKGIALKLRSKVQGIAQGAGQCVVTALTGEGTEEIAADKVLLSVGRTGNLSAAEGLGIAGERGRIAVNDKMETSMAGVYAAGDINGRLMLAHAAFKMGEVAAINAMGGNERADLTKTPSCVYCTPEIASVGLTEEQARRRGEINVGKFYFSANGRALASGAGEGFVKVITDQAYGELLGVHIAGPGATEIINQAASLMAMEITAEEIARTIFAHPTCGEAFLEAAADSFGMSVHLPPRNGGRRG